jgi:hypothetical protein
MTQDERLSALEKEVAALKLQLEKRPGITLSECLPCGRHPMRWI